MYTNSEEMKNIVDNATKMVNLIQDPFMQEYFFKKPNKANEQNRIRDVEIRNKLTVAGARRRRIRQRV